MVILSVCPTGANVIISTLVGILAGAMALAPLEGLAYTCYYFGIRIELPTFFD